jgi:hypothetical protein
LGCSVTPYSPYPLPPGKRNSKHGPPLHPLSRLIYPLCILSLPLSSSSSLSIPISPHLFSFSSYPISSLLLPLPQLSISSYLSIPFYLSIYLYLLSYLSRIYSVYLSITSSYPYPSIPSPPLPLPRYKPNTI